MKRRVRSRRKVREPGRDVPLFLSDATWARLDALAPLYVVGTYEVRLYDYLPAVLLAGLRVEEARLAKKIDERPPADEPSK